MIPSLDIGALGRNGYCPDCWEFVGSSLQFNLGENTYCDCNANTCGYDGTCCIPAITTCQEMDTGSFVFSLPLSPFLSFSFVFGQKCGLGKELHGSWQPVMRKQSTSRVCRALARLGGDIRKTGKFAYVRNVKTNMQTDRAVKMIAPQS